MSSSLPNVRRAQKESQLFREISSLLLQASLDDPKLRSVTITRVALSPDKGLCTIYCYTSEGKDFFQKELLHILMQYKPSLRKALAAQVQLRYTPELGFAYDAQLEKQLRVEELIEKVKNEEEE